MENHKVCLISTVHSALDVRIFYKQARSLKKAGYDVTIIAQADKEQVLDGIKIKPLHKPKNRIMRMIFLSMQAYREARALKAHIYHFHDPELIPLGLCLKLRKARVIYDVHEDLPLQIMDKHWIPKPLRPLISQSASFFEKRAANRFEAVITVTEDIASQFELKKKSIVKVIHNYPLSEEFSMNSSSEVIETYNNQVVYLGDISLERGLLEMVKAVNILSGKYKVELVLGGRFISVELEENSKRLAGWNKVNYKGWLERKEVVDTMQAAKAGLVLLHRKTRFLQSLPLKLFEYMAAGIPVIASDFPRWKKIIEDSGCGLTVDPLKPQAIAEAICYILDNPAKAKDMGLKGKEAFENNYNWAGEEKKLLDLYQELLAGEMSFEK